MGTDKTDRAKTPKPADAARAARLKAALKANIAKRKEQARVRVDRQTPQDTNKS